MNTPKYHEMIWPTLVALKGSGGSATNQEILSSVTQIMGLTDDVLSVLHKEGPQTKVAYQLHWARTYLKKTGAIENSLRGVWSITPYGRSLTEADARKIPSIVKRLDRESILPLITGEKADKDGDAGPTYTLYDEEAWKETLLSILKGMKPDAFERLSQRILRESGFVEVIVTGRPNDGGIDGVGVLRVNLLSFRVFFQCKRYSNSVGAGAIRDFRGAMAGRTDKGVLITTGTFTAEAKREATRDGAPPVDLIDGDELCDLLKKLNLGVRTEMVERVVVTGEAFQQFEASNDAAR